MYNYELDRIMARERYNDRLREAEHDRLVWLALQGRNQRDGLLCRALLMLGRRLATLGARLEEEYGGAAELPALGAAGSRSA